MCYFTINIYFDKIQIGGFMEWNNFCGNIKEILTMISRRIDLNFNINEESIAFSIDGREYNYTKEQYNQSIKGLKKHSDGYIYSDNYYEVMLDVKNDSRPSYFMSIERFVDYFKEVFEDKENGLLYCLGHMSHKFIITNFDVLINNLSPAYISLHTTERIKENFKENQNDIPLFVLLRMFFRSNLTLKIKNEKGLNIENIASAADSFLYNVTYNTNIVFKKSNFLSNNLKLSEFNTSRRRFNNNISAPKRKYNPKLIEQYDTATSSGDPFVQFICYYHIIEHFYEDVYNEELIKLIRMEITSPAFSAKNDKSIAKIVDIVKKKIKQNKEEFSINELEALELVLRKYVRLDDLKLQLEELEPKCIDYYNNNKVKFCDGAKLNFSDLKDETNYKNIAKRIYSTRNALVHYKSNDKVNKELKVYSPLNDKEILFKEIPLMKVIAEIIIHYNSTII